MAMAMLAQRRCQTPTCSDRAAPGLPGPWVPVLVFFGQADGGVLFLDEIGDTPLTIQPALLRALEQGELQRPGAAHPTQVDVRVIAATDADLWVDVASGRFKRPLLHRLSGYCLAVPPLRQRRDDIGRLLYHFLVEELRQVGQTERLRLESPREQPWIPTALITSLLEHDWPGNVRELRNIARRIVITSVHAEAVDVALVLEGLTPGTARPCKPETAELTSPTSPEELTEALVVAAMREHGYSTSAVAEALGISRTTLYTLIERFPGLRKASDLSDAEITAALAASHQDVGRAAELLEVSERALKLRLRRVEG